MRFDASAILALVLGDAGADRVVPRIGLTSWLVVFTSGAMAFLAVFAMALMLTTGRVADAWTAELDRGATIRVNAPPAELALRTADVMRILQTTPGIADARVLTDDDQRALLEPWLGPDLPLSRIPLPRLIEIEVDADYDPTSLRLRLAGEVPAAQLDDHARWRAPLIAAATRVRLLGIGAVLLIGGVMAAMITLASRAALAANTQVIEVLRLIGARDVYVARAFVRRITLRATAGTLLGTVLGVGAVALVPPAVQDTGLLAAFGFHGAQWAWPLILPITGGILAFLATRAAALAALKRTR